MRRVVIAVAAAVVLAGCGGSDGEPGPKKASAAPKLMELADACVEVNKAAEQTLKDSNGLADPQSLYDFGVAVEAISEKTDERGRDAVFDLATRSHSVSDALASSRKPEERLEAGLDMLNGYKRLQDACQAVGAPLSVPGSG